MKTVRLFGLVVAVLLIGYHIFSLDFEDLRFSTNKRHYLGIVAMVLVSLSFLIGVIKDRHKNN